VLRRLAEQLPGRTAGPAAPDDSAAGAELDRKHPPESRYLDAPISNVVEGVIAKRIKEKTWTEERGDDVRTSMSFFITANGDLRYSSICQHHVAKAAGLFTKLPTGYGRMPAYVKHGLAAALHEVEELARRGKAPPLGLSAPTINKHLTWISKVFSEAELIGYPPLGLSFNGFRRKGRQLNACKKNQKRPPWTVHEFKRLLSGPIYEGCAGLFQRLRPGDSIFHDGMYFGLLLLINTAGRSAEGNGIALADIVLDAEIPYFHIRENDLRGLKTMASERKLPILPALLNLGFADYVEALRAAGHVALFPEFVHPTMSFSKVFNKNVFTPLRKYHFPAGTSQLRGRKDVDVVSIRAMIATYLQEHVGDPTLRIYILGHEQHAMTQKIYEDDPTLRRLKREMLCLENLFAHIKPSALNLRPSEWQKFGSLRGRPKAL
jgi:integrase